MISNQENAMSRLQFGSGRLLDDLIAATGIKNRPAQIIMIGDEFQLPAASVSTPPALTWPTTGITSWRLKSMS
ncbi:MAG: hypothetical protein ACLSH6_08155 [Limosilactobacillus pontis]